MQWNTVLNKWRLDLQSNFHEGPTASKCYLQITDNQDIMIHMLRMKHTPPIFFSVHSLDFLLFCYH